MDFQQWLKLRRLKEGLGDGGGNPAEDGFKFNQDDNDVGDDYEHIQQELFKTIYSKYPDETMQFLNGIAQRGDEEVAALVRRLRKDKRPVQFKEPQHSTDGDEVVPSNADTGSGGGNGESSE